MASLFGGNVSRASSHDAEQALQNILQQNQLAGQSADFYNQGIQALTPAQQYFFNLAFPGMTPGGFGYSQAPVSQTQMGTAPGVNGGQPFAAFGSRKTLPGFQQTQAAGTQVGPSIQDRIANNVLGIYNSQPYQAVRNAAQEDINRNAVNLGHAYDNNLTGRGLGNSSLLAGGLSNINASANKNYSDFLRQQAMNAVTEQSQRVGNYVNSLSPNFAAGGLANQAYQGAGGLATQGIGVNQQAKNQQGSILDNLVGSLGQAAGQYFSGGFTGGGGGGGVTNPGGIAGDTAAAGINDGGALGMSAFAGGGFVHAGAPILTGEKGKETFVPAGGGKEPTINIPHSLFAKWMDHTMGECANMPHRAGGGMVQAGQAYQVGEHGPEVMVAPTNGWILPHSPQDFNAQGWQGGTAHPLETYIQLLREVGGG